MPDSVDKEGILAGKVAIVTGGTEGIGRGIAEALGAAGAGVAVVSRRESAVAEAQKQLAELGIDALGVATDVRDVSSVARMVDAVRDRFGGIDILVNSAGGSFGDSFERGPVLDLRPEDLIEGYRLNVVGTFICTKAVVPEMRARGGGSVVNIGSMAAYSAARGMASYGATKAALNSLTRSMARELAPDIRLNVVAPGHIDTPRTNGRRDEAKRARQLAETPMGRYGTPDDVAGAVLYLASPAASWVTGEVIRIAGGMGGE
ncbi:glucose 1-dehydrogenase [Rugosimonospora acidiphila]|uniref:Glucose 1-dehydrogenase n=1 Tax=Rugosimonospora acidiphila TaxID=556531 RepID=A0ABP9SUD2_9ACTN